MTKILESLNGFVWGAPALLLILGVGLFLSIRTGFAQITLFPAAFRNFLDAFRRKGEQDSPYQALCTALAATVGTGNLVGVAGAICIGGPGSIFWMWICGILGMVTKFAEATLAVRYRVKTENGFSGGPMYMIDLGMGSRWKWLSRSYALFGVVAAFGVGNATQINAVVAGCNAVLSRFGKQESLLTNLLLGLFLAALIWAMLSGGGKRIGQAAEKLVPFASAAYILLCAGVLVLRHSQIGPAFAAIFRGAVSPGAVTGGMLGSAFTALRTGCSRGVFTNEAGMGTASIAHGSAKVSHPVEQGFMGIMEVFLDTILICTLTALVILCSGVSIPFGRDAGGALTTLAFSAVYGDGVAFFLAAALCCFAFATVLGWSFYGVRCAAFLFGNRGGKGFVRLQTMMVVFAAVMEPGIVWTLAETMNGLMAIPNLIALAVLSPELCRLTIEYKEKTGGKAGGGSLCRFPLTQTVANPLPCGNSTLMRWKRKNRERKSIT